MHIGEFEVLAVSETGQDQIIILNASAIVSGGMIVYSATFSNNISTNSSFDAITRLDTPERVIALKSERVTLQPGEEITLSGTFPIPDPGEYVVQWEALTPPPGNPLATRTRVEVSSSEGTNFVIIVLVIVLFAATIASTITYRYRTRVWKRFRSNSIGQP